MDRETYLAMKELKRKPDRPMGDWCPGFNVPNHSGDHKSGIVTQAPVDNLDIVNKAYVDTAITGIVNVPNADTVDGLHASDFAVSGSYILDTGDTATGDYDFANSTLSISQNRIGIGTSYPITVSSDGNGTTVFDKALRTSYGDPYDSHQIEFRVPQSNYGWESYRFLEGGTLLMGIGTAGIKLKDNTTITGLGTLYIKKIGIIADGVSTLSLYSNAESGIYDGSRILIGDLYNNYVKIFSPTILKFKEVYGIAGVNLTIQKGMTSQTGDFTQWKDYGGDVLSNIDVAGNAAFPIVTVGNGATNTFTTVDGKTVTVSGGIVISIV